MKTIIISIGSLFFCLISYSQTAKISFEEAAKTDLVTLKKIVIITPEQEQPLLDFFYRKYKQYSVFTLTEIQKKEINAEYQIELRNLIGPQDNGKLTENKAILIKLVSE
jgi:hypothetical protein